MKNYTFNGRKILKNVINLDINMKNLFNNVFECRQFSFYIKNFN